MSSTTFSSIFDLFHLDKKLKQKMVLNLNNKIISGKKKKSRKPFLIQKTKYIYIFRILLNFLKLFYRSVLRVIIVLANSFDRILMEILNTDLPPNKNIYQEKPAKRPVRLQNPRLGYLIANPS